MKARTSLYLSIILLISVMGATTACSKAPNDTQISSQLQDRLNSDSGLQGKQLSVQSLNGTVTISGSVDNDAQRDAASRYAAAIPGVKQDVNIRRVGAPREQIADQAPPPAPVETAKPAPATRKTTPRKRTQRTDSASVTPMAAPTGTQMAMNHQDAPPTPPPAP